MHYLSGPNLTKLQEVMWTKIEALNFYLFIFCTLTALHFKKSFLFISFIPKKVVQLHSCAGI